MLSVTINGDTVTINAPYCLTTILSLQSISGQLKTVLTKLKTEGSHASYGSVSYAVGNKQQLRRRILTYSMGQNMRSFISEDVLEPGLAIVPENSIIIYFHSDRNIDLKPMVCRNIEERRFVDNNKSNSGMRELTSKEKEDFVQMMGAGKERPKNKQEEHEDKQEQHEDKQEQREDRQEEREDDQEETEE